MTSIEESAPSKFGWEPKIQTVDPNVIRIVYVHSYAHFSSYFSFLSVVIRLFSLITAVDTALAKLLPVVNTSMFLKMLMNKIVHGKSVVAMDALKDAAFQSMIVFSKPISTRVSMTNKMPVGILVATKVKAPLLNKERNFDSAGLIVANATITLPLATTLNTLVKVFITFLARPGAAVCPLVLVVAVIVAMDLAQRMEHPQWNVVLSLALLKENLLMCRMP
jgi:hypothetical protein